MTKPRRIPPIPPPRHTPPRVPITQTLPKPRLPKLPPPPRPSPPPEWDDDGPSITINEAPTPTKNLNLQVYQGLLSVFDELSDDVRMEFVELAFLFKDISPEDRKMLLEIASLASTRKSRT